MIGGFGVVVEWVIFFRLVFLCEWFGYFNIGIEGKIERLWLGKV